MQKIVLSFREHVGHIGGSAKGVVMDKYQLVVSSYGYIGFDTVGSDIPGFFKGRHGVFRCQAGCPSVSYVDYFLRHGQSMVISAGAARSAPAFVVAGE